MNPMNILITGGSGFIGTNLVSDLLLEGHKVLIYDKRKSKTYPDLSVEADVRDKEKLANSMRGIDAVYHLAAEHRDDVRPVSLYDEVNVGGARNVVYALEKNNVNKLIFTSTVAVYGLNAGMPDENSSIRPFNDYGRSKYQSELVFSEWAGSDRDRSLVIIRPTVIFGEGNRGKVCSLLSQIASKRFIMVGNGKNRKSMGYVRNISHFLTMILGSTSGRHVYNYADKPDFSTKQLVATVSNALGKDRKINFRLPYSVGLLGGYAFDLLAKITGRTYPISSIRIKKFCADTRVSAEKLRETGFTAPYSLADGLNRTISKEFIQD
ncbi:MAG: NAD-dependent epimerase/dehydratase family protein [Actinomycetia bacterium]|nr:NAD-dependent epimerase/dehydratase family protein [Actinomycetes bacterium]